MTFYINACDSTIPKKNHTFIMSMSLPGLKRMRVNREKLFSKKVPQNVSFINFSDNEVKVDDFSLIYSQIYLSITTTKTLFSFLKEESLNQHYFP